MFYYVHLCQGSQGKISPGTKFVDACTIVGNDCSRTTAWGHKRAFGVSNLASGFLLEADVPELYGRNSYSAKAKYGARIGRPLTGRSHHRLPRDLSGASSIGQTERV